MQDHYVACLCFLKASSLGWLKHHLFGDVVLVLCRLAKHLHEDKEVTERENTFKNRTYSNRPFPQMSQ